MTTYKSLRFAILPLLFLLTIAGCGDRCKNVDCGENGTCMEGVCICESGFGGTNCDIEVADFYARTYNLEETCLAGDDFYTVTGLRGDENDPFAVEWVGVWDLFNDTLVGNVSDDGSNLVFERQRIGNVEISGTATRTDLDGIGLNFTYEVFQPGQSTAFDNCSATMEAQ